MGSASDPLSERHGWDGGGDPLSLELGARIELLEQLRVLASPGDLFGMRYPFAA